MKLTKEYLTELLRTNDKAVARALLVVNKNQTTDEQLSETTRYRNGMGFRPCHARMGTSMAQFYGRRGYLTDKQIAYWRKPDATGTMRIALYWGQLAEAAEKRTKDVMAKAIEDQAAEWAARVAHKEAALRHETTKAEFAAQEPA